MSGKEIGYTYSKLVTVSGDNGNPGGTKTNFRINLGNNMQKIARVSIASVLFPNNAYNVNATGGGANNTFGFADDYAANLLSVEGGFYTTSTLMAAVQDAIQGVIDPDGDTVTLTQDVTTQLVTVSFTAAVDSNTFDLYDSGNGVNDPGDPGFNPALGIPGIWELLGFDLGPSGYIRLAAGIGVTRSTTATNLPSLAGLKTVYLQSNTFAPGNMFDRDGDQKNTLLVIPITVQFGVSNVFECKVDSLCEITYLSSRMCQEADFYLTDKAGNMVDLHGGNLVVNLKVWFNRF